MKHLLVLVCLVVLTGCASLSEEECLAGDWAAIGQRDGAAGLVAQTQFARHVAACEKVGVTPARAAWQTGYARGLQNYCTPLNGLEVGLNGRSYRNVCPAGSEAGFLRGYRVGTADYDARQEVDRIEREIAQLRARNNEILAIVSTTETPGLLQELQANRAEILRLTLELGFARAERARTRRDVAEFRAG